jgi:predicted SAM-dependent methyltransferase
MRLHLGCGQRYLEGYLNIDFPSREHTVQTTSVADLHADLCTLRYPSGTIDEIRLHHVFEHFPRPIASALLAVWHSWLRPGGILHLEVPDFARSAAVILDRWSSPQAKAVAERHLYGSHEAAWAVHCEGYTPAMLKAFVAVFGFKTEQVQNKSWQGTHNVELIARRDENTYCLTEFQKRAEEYLRLFLLDGSPGEKAMLGGWMEAFCRQAVRGGVTDG